jgi:hypothetical protein
MRSLDLNNLLSCHLTYLHCSVHGFLSSKRIIVHAFLWYNDRYLRYLDYEVCYVRNFTDIDDKVTFRLNLIYK